MRKKFGTCPSWRTDSERFDKYQRNVEQFLEDRIFDSDPEGARVYASKGSATTSVGKWSRSGNSWRGKMVLPSHLEIHEIKESYVCVMRPDGSSNCDDDDEKEN
jgi:hypothetical protein